MVDATAPETCLLSVDYGLLHVAMVLWMLLVCWRKGRTQVRLSAHNTASTSLHRHTRSATRWLFWNRQACQSHAVAGVQRGQGVYRQCHQLAVGT